MKNDELAMSQTIRAFIAFELPAAVISLLDNLQQGLKSLRLNARWVRPQNIHLTLKFLGNIDPGDIGIIGGAMADAVGDCAPLTLSVGGLGFFPGIKRPRVVWVGLGGEITALQNLQRNLDDRLAGVGFAKEKKSFTGHLTLGRFKGASNRETIRQIMSDYSDVAGADFTANRIILFKSDLQPSGAVYTRLKQAELTE
jgi:2'-5' RNA ligase